MRSAGLDVEECSPDPSAIRVVDGFRLSGRVPARRGAASWASDERSCRCQKALSTGCQLESLDRTPEMVASSAPIRTRLHAIRSIARAVKSSAMRTIRSLDHRRNPSSRRSAGLGVEHHDVSELAVSRRARRAADQVGDLRRCGRRRQEVGDIVCQTGGPAAARAAITVARLAIG